jgi:hypothetical protein
MIGLVDDGGRSFIFIFIFFGFIDNVIQVKGENPK